MSYKIGDLSRGPCCEINKLIVQVVGKNHPATQRLAFYEKDADKRLDELTAEDDPETVTAWMCKPSSLHVWGWTGEPGHRMVLEVEDERGAIIKLPLPDVHITIRQLDKQWNQIVPVLPFVPLPGISSAQDHGTPVLCRPGYLYVFMEGRLWRELEIRITDERTTYHDIELDKFRVEDGFVDDARLATGKALDDIWLPANWNDRRVDIQLCFSEVQLSHARLKRLEQDPALRRQRCQSPDLRVSKEDSKRRFTDKPDGAAMLETFRSFDAFDEINQSQTAAHATWLNLKQHAFPLSVPAPQRARQVGFEWMLDQPAQYVCDLSGEFLANAFMDARQHVLACEKGDAPYRPRLLETGAWAQRLEQIVAPADGENVGLWEAHPPVADVLSKARTRELHGVMVVDTQYRLRHLNMRIQDQRNLLQLCGERAQHYPYHGSALLLQQLLAPERIRGKTNPLHKRLDSLKEQGLRDINRFTASSERAQLWRQLEMCQSLLGECLQLPAAEQSLADHFSQNHFYYAAALYFVSQLFATLAMRPAQSDPLAASADITDATTGLSLYSANASAGQQWIHKVVNDTAHPLHRMLWPDTDAQNLNAPYQPPTAPNVDHGDGSFRATELAKVEQEDLWPVEHYHTIDSLFLASVLKKGDLKNTLTLVAKAGAGALVSIAENMQGAIEAAERAVEAAKVAGLDEADTRPWRLSEALHRRSIAQMRSMLPQSLGDLHFLPRNEALNKDYYVFGLDDAPTKIPRSAQPYGVYRNQHGVLNPPAEEFEYSHPQGLRSDRVVLGMPRNHRTALAVSRVNQRFNEAWQNEITTRVAEHGTKVTAFEHAKILRDVARDSSLAWMLNSVPVAGLIVGLEIFNLTNELGARGQTGREKGEGRAKLGVASAVLDLVIAMEAVTVKIVASNSLLAVGKKTVFTIPDEMAKKALGALSNRVVKKLSSRLLALVGTGLTFTGISLHDAWYSYKWSDDAYIGHLIMAAGGLAASATNVIIPGTLFLGLSRLGWVGLVLIVIGAGVAYALSSKPIDDWLRKGPFGEDADGVASHLQNPELAFYYLVGLFANVRIGIYRNPDYIPDAKIDYRDPVPFRVRTADTCIRIKSNLSGLFSGLDYRETKAFLNLKSFEMFYETSSERSRTTSSQVDVTPVAHRLWPESLELFVKTPFSYEAEPAENLPEVYHVWRVRAQLTLKDGQRTWVFPTPPPKDPTPFSPAYSKHDFESRNTLFWADETEHRAKEVK